MDLANIIVATDLSEPCGAAARWAQQLKDRGDGAQVFVTHVIELSVSSWLASAFEVLDDPAKRADAEQKVVDWYTEQTGSAPDGVMLRAGGCVAQLHEVASSMTGETLLVVSRSGKGTFTRFLLGSTAHALASQPPCPVAIVHPEHTEFRAGSPVLTGTDLSRNGKRAVAYAANLARSVGVPLEVVYAYGAPTSPLVNLQLDRSQQTIEKKVTRKIERQPGLDEDVDLHVRVLYEDPAPAIVEHAKKVDADVIVLGHSGESKFTRSVLGSVSQGVLNHMPCSVIILPSVGFDDQRFTDDEEE